MILRASKLVFSSYKLFSLNEIELIYFSFFQIIPALSHMLGLTSAEVVYMQPSSIDEQKPPTISLKCRVDGNRLDSIQWLKDGEPLNIVGSLIIRYPTQNDSGYYKCLARNKFGTVESHPLLVDIHPNTHNAFHSIWICELKISNDNYMEKNLLCRFKRKGRSHRKRSALDGGSQLYQTSKRKKITVAEDITAMINCDVSRLGGKAKDLSVRWKKDGKLIRQSTLISANIDMQTPSPTENPLFHGRIIMNPKNGSITITATIPSDSGIYEVSLVFLFGFNIDKNF